MKLSFFALPGIDQDRTSRRMPELCHALFRVTAAHPHMTLISLWNKSSCYQKMKMVPQSRQDVLGATLR